MFAEHALTFLIQFNDIQSRFEFIFWLNPAKNSISMQKISFFFLLSKCEGLLGETNHYRLETLALEYNWNNVRWLFISVVLLCWNKK